MDGWGVDGGWMDGGWIDECIIERVDQLMDAWMDG